MRLIISLLIVSLLTVSCKENRNGFKSRTAIVEVNDHVLYRETLEENIPDGISSEDSIIIAEHFIHTWIVEQLLYEVASSNVADEKMIDELVENYRKSLVVYQYKENLVNEKVSRNIGMNEMLNYYNENTDKFKLDRPLVKGLFLQIPVDAPAIDQVRAWSKTLTPASLSSIEKYCVQNALPYNYITEDWVDYAELTLNWPVSYKNEITVISNNRFIEEKDDKFYYFFHITAYLLPGDNAPFEYAQSAVKEILINQKKIEFMKSMEDDLYHKALGTGKIYFYTD